MSSFSPSTAELALVNNVFAVADPQKLGIITGDKAVEAFSGANLPPSVLGEIWTIADKENNGFLTRKGVAIALRLIGHAQKGEKVNESLLERPGPLAHIEGVSPKPSTLLSSAPKSPQSTALHPPLTPEDKTKFLRLFLGCGPVNGLLSGDKARDVFVKSKLPFEALSQIWTLADTQDRGSLDQTDFTIAMYFIQAIMSGQLKSPPATLPPGLYEQAGGRGPTGVVSHGTGNSMISLSPSLTGFFSPAATAPTPLAAQTTGTGTRRLQPQTTGQEYSRLSMAIPNQPSVHFAPNPVTALGASAFGTAAQPWDVTSEEKTRFDQFFDSLDTTKRGFIEGDVAVPFMLQSKLSEDVLAQVWDLADLNNDGRLTRDGFAVAMHLIQGKLAGKEIPATLPVSLVPPAMRAPRLGGAAQVSTAASAPAPVPEPVRDLLWDDSPPASATSPPPPASTFGSPSPTHATPVLQPQLTGRVSQQHIGVASPKPPSIPPRATDPFGTAPFSPPSNRDLLSDDEGKPSSSVPDNSAEIGNVQNQLNSTNRSLETTKAERQTVESSLASQARQLSALQTQLSSAKAAYETETKLLETLRERFAAQSKDIAQTREQLISAESDLSALRVEKAEVEGAVLRDKEEVRELQRRMKEVGEEAERTKADIEKAKKETKHQKGLLAIAKKQLATREAERAKLAKELEDAERETHETIEELQATEAELAKEPEPIQTNGIASPVPVASEPLRMDTPSIAAQQPLPASPPPSIGSPTSARATNPFERLMMQSPGSRPASPFVAPTTDTLSAPTPQIRPPTETIQASPFAPLVPEQKTAEVPQAAYVVAAEPSTSTTGPASSIDDPFGLGDADKSSATSIAESPDKTSALAPDFVTSPIAVESQDKTATPLAEPEVISKVPERSPSSNDVVDAAAKHFPAVDSQVPSGSTNIENDAHTDLNSKLAEKEAEESDSDSDNERDFHDAKEARTSTGSAFDESTKGLAVGTTNNSLEPTPTTTSNTFEDAFGLKENESKMETSVGGLPENKVTMTDLFFSEPQPMDKAPVNGKIPEGSSPFDSVPTAASGVNAFDEAMGKISTPGTGSAAPRFQLDSAFDDNFDFNAAKAELGPTPASAFVPPVPVLNGSSQELPKTVPDFGSAFTPAPSGQDTTSKVQEANKPALSFDDAFGSAGSSQMSSRPPQPSVGDLGISFEDAFGGGGDQALALNFNAPSASTSITTQPRQPDAEATTQRIQSPPRSPQVTAPPASPPAARSPSPPPRRSTGSSTDGSVHGKPPPQHRHSKLSIRLPFGRKDKKKAKHEPPPMPPPHFLGPVVEPQDTTGTPAVEDDVEPVKQLCSMGFSRSQALEALEKHGYDVQRALNSLLGTA
ncbi:hypothetical protein ACEPAF_4704 [Sanghuangporus sanghuang]